MAGCGWGKASWQRVWLHVFRVKIPRKFRHYEGVQPVRPRHGTQGGCVRLLVLSRIC